MSVEPGLLEGQEAAARLGTPANIQLKNCFKTENFKISGIIFFLSNQFWTNILKRHSVFMSGQNANIGFLTS